MTLNKDNLTKMARRILRPERSLQSPQLMHPTREWFVGLLLAVGVFASSAAWSAHMYVQHRDMAVSGAGVETDVVVYRESMVTAALADFAERAATHEELLSFAREVTPDPATSAEALPVATTTEPTEPTEDAAPATSTEATPGEEVPVNLEVR